MSFSKRLRSEDSPEHDEARAILREQARGRIEEFLEKIPTRRKNRTGTSARWDPLWPTSVEEAAEDLGIEFIRVNDQICVRIMDEVNQVLAKAVAIWEGKHQQYLALMARR